MSIFAFFVLYIIVNVNDNNISTFINIALFESKSQSPSQIKNRHKYIKLTLKTIWNIQTRFTKTVILKIDLQLLLSFIKNIEKWKSHIKNIFIKNHIHVLIIKITLICLYKLLTKSKYLSHTITVNYYKKHKIIYILNFLFIYIDYYYKQWNYV